MRFALIAGIAAALLREEDEDLPEVRSFRDKEGIDYKSIPSLLFKTIYTTIRCT